MAIITFNKGTPNTGSNQVHYAGHVLPQDKKKYNKPPVDQTNNPSVIEIGLTVGTGQSNKTITNALGGTATINGSIQLPLDTSISISGEKTIAITKILDGVQVVERILRDPYEIEFQGIFRNPDIASANKSTFDGNWTFPQDTIDQAISNIFIPDSVMQVNNTFLNKIGVKELVIKRVELNTIRGSTNVEFRIQTIENVTGQTLIVS